MAAVAVDQLEQNAMKIITKAVYDIETGALVEEDSYEYDGPVALCDRSAHKQSNEAGQAALDASKQYSDQADAIQSPLVKTLQQWTTAPPGFSAGDLNTMQNRAQAAAGATANDANQQMVLNAMRSGNGANLGAGQAAGVEAATRGQLSAIQDILGQNAQLKAQQQEGALQGLGSILGTDVRAQEGNLGIVPGAANAASNADNSGWFQNMLNYMNTVSGSAANLAKAGR